MLRINLLPPYIYEGAKRRNVMALWVVLLALTVGGFIYWKVQLDAQAQEIVSKTKAIEGDANLADTTKSKTTALLASNASLKGKWDFVKRANEYVGTTYPNMFNNVRDYTLDRVVYSSIIPAGQNVTISAFARDLTDVGHYMMAMERNKEVSNVSIALGTIPGFGAGGGGQGQGRAMMGPMAGMMRPSGGVGGPGGANVGMMRMMGSMGGGGGPVGGGASAGPPPQAASMMMAMRGGNIGGGMPGGAAALGGARMGGQQAAGNRPPGHDFTVTLTLVNPIPPAPSYVPSAAAGAAAGGGMSSMMMGPAMRGGGGAAPASGGGGPKGGGAEI